MGFRCGRLAAVRPATQSSVGSRCQAARYHSMGSAAAAAGTFASPQPGSSTVVGMPCLRCPEEQVALANDTTAASRSKVMQHPATRPDLSAACVRAWMCRVQAGLGFGKSPEASSPEGATPTAASLDKSKARAATGAGRAGRAAEPWRACLRHAPLVSHV
jgi:hypothetical protein